MYLDCIYFRVAGVSFDNDNGTSRQRYISKLKPFDALGMVSFDYEGDTAFHILDEHGHCIGNLPKEHVDFVLDHYNQGHKITLYITDILGLDEDGHRIDGYNLGVEVCLDVHDDRPDAPEEKSESKPSTFEDVPVPKKEAQDRKCNDRFWRVLCPRFLCGIQPHCADHRSIAIIFRYPQTQSIQGTGK